MTQKAKYKKLVIYYFSGTGNSKNVAHWIADYSMSQSIKSEIINIAQIDRTKITVPRENSLIGFCSPTHGFHFPQIMRNFIFSYPKVKNCSVFIINTRAGLRLGKLFIPGLSGVLHYYELLVLLFKGFSIVGGRPIDLPSNWISIHPALRKKSVDLMFNRCKTISEEFINRILQGRRNFRAFYDIIQDIIISPVALAYILIGRFFFAKSYIASGDCDDCGSCLKTCPVCAIKKVNGRMYWTYKCESCMRCMNNCPKQAIETAHSFLIGFYLLFSLFVFEGIISFIEYVYPENEWTWLSNEISRFIIETALVLPLLFFFYRVLHFFMKFRLVRKIIAYSSLTKYKFWGRYKAWKIKKS